MTDTQDEFEAAFREISEGKADGEPGAPDGENTESQPPSEPEAESEAASAEEDQAGAPNEPPAENPEPANQDEIWANATPEQRAAYEAAEERAKKVEQRLKSDDGRVARYQRDRDAMKRKLETLTAAAEKDGEDLRALIASDDWKAAKSDYGEDLAPLFNVLERLTDQQASVGERFKQMDSDDIDRMEADNYQQLREKAPDYETLLQRPDFSEWLQSQPEIYQQAYAQNYERLVDPSSALELVNKFRAWAHVKDSSSTPAPEKKQDPRRARQLDGARSVNSRTPVVADPGGNDFEAEFNRASKALERQKAQR